VQRPNKFTSGKVEVKADIFVMQIKNKTRKLSVLLTFKNVLSSNNVHHQDPVIKHEFGVSLSFDVSIPLAPPVEQNLINAELLL